MGAKVSRPFALARHIPKTYCQRWRVVAGRRPRQKRRVHASPTVGVARRRHYLNARMLKLLAIRHWHGLDRHCIRQGPAGKPALVDARKAAIGVHGLQAVLPAADDGLIGLQGKRQV